MSRYIPALPWSSHGSELVTLFTNCAIEASVVFLPLFAQEIGASKFQVGVIGGAYGISYFVSSWVFGRQSDMKGRVLFIRLGLGLGTLTLAMQTLAPNPFILAFARALVGFCLGISAAALMAYNFEAGGSTGRFASLGALGWLIGDVIAILVHNYHSLFLLSSASCGLAFAISLSLEEQKGRHPLKPATIRVVYRNIRVYLSFFLRHLGATMVWVIFPLFLATIGASKTWIAILSAINTGGQFITMLFIERLKESRIFLLGSLLSALVFLAYAQVTGYLQVIPVQVLLAVAWSCLYVGALLLVLKNNEERATSTGILFSTISISGAVGPFLGGLVAQFWGYSPLMYLASGLCLMAAGIVMVKSA